MYDICILVNFKDEKVGEPAAIQQKKKPLETCRRCLTVVLLFPQSDSPVAQCTGKCQHQVHEI